MNAKYTPGPWIEAGPSYGKPCMVEVTEVVTIHGETDDDESDTICEFPSYIDNETRSANARLISCAPEMVDALKMCLDALYDSMKIAPLDRLSGKAPAAIQQAQFILNKATGSEI